MDFSCTLWCINLFVVMAKEHCLLGYVFSKKLGILRIGSEASSETVCRSSEDTDIRSELVSNYPKMFTGIGKLAGYKLKLHIDEKINPVAQKPRKTPLALCDRITAEVEKFIEKDIVKRVEGPTSWVSHIVVAPKKSGSINLCIDMGCTHETIPMPTVDEVLENLKGSTMFSKVDRHFGFHQVELDEDLQDITTFATHDGLFPVQEADVLGKSSKSFDRPCLE